MAALSLTSLVLALNATPNTEMTLLVRLLNIDTIYMHINDEPYNLLGESVLLMFIQDVHLAPICGHLIQVQCLRQIYQTQKILPQA